jgi:CDK inhibitor PHO81
LLKSLLDPVFFASQCGQKGSVTPSRTTLSIEDARDRRLTCLGAAVNFSKKNNLLGVFIDAAVLVTSDSVVQLDLGAYCFSQVQVPSLIDAIRDAGLVVCVYGASDMLDTGAEGSRVDAFLQGGMVIYKEHGLYV